MSDIEDVIKIRKYKRYLYIELLRKGYDNLTDTERGVAAHLSVDKDILILIKNGDLFQNIMKE